MTRGGRVFVWTLLALALAAGTGWWFATFHRVERWIDLPPRGEASYNPLYALKATLRADGQRVESRQRLQLSQLSLAPQDTVLVYSDPRTLAPDEVDALLAFAARGGHVVLRVPPYENHAGTHLSAFLARRLSLQPVLLRSRCIALLPGARDPGWGFCQGARFRLRDDAPASLQWGDADGLVFARMVRGAGSVDLWSDLMFLDNQALRMPSNRLLARQLLAPNYGRGTFHLVYAANMPPLWRLLLANGWMALLPLLLATLGWLWLHAQRMGPRIPSPPASRRALIEHVQASGEHLLRYGRLPLLHRAVRDALVARLRRRDPMAATASGDAQAALLAARLGLPVDELVATLSTRPPHDTREYRQRISQLIALRNRL